MFSCFKNIKEKKKFKIKLKKIIVFILLIPLIIGNSCMTEKKEVLIKKPQVVIEKEYTSQDNNPIFIIISKNHEVDKAKVNAFILAVKDTIKKIITSDLYEAKYEIINKYIINEAVNYVSDYNILEKEKKSGLVFIKIKIVVNQKKVKERLVELNIIKIKKEITNKNPPSKENNIKNNNKLKKDVKIDFNRKAEKILSHLNEEERNIILNYIDNIMYMVYYNEKNISINKEYIKYSVTRINSYLEKKGKRYIEPEQILKLKKDKTILKTIKNKNEFNNLIIASKVNSDIYISVDIKISSEQKNNTFFAKVTIYLKIYDVPLQKLLCDFKMSSKKYNSQSSLDVAVRNAIDSVVNLKMNKILDLLRNRMIILFEDGIRYMIIFRKYSFSTKLELEKIIQNINGVKRVELNKENHEEIKYFVYFMGTLDDLEQAIFEEVSGIKEFEKFDEVMKKHNLIIFSM